MKASPLLVGLVLLSACPEGERSVTLRFAPMFGAAPFACGTPLEAVGAGKSRAEARDFRMYVSQVELIDRDGGRAPLALVEDPWQHGEVALLDFEDGRGACTTGSEATNLELRGTVPAGDYVGLAFVVGVPEEDNHLDAATAAAPLNVQGMWWSWAGGYKYMRVDLAPEGQPEFFFHLGATSCAGTVAEGFTCEHGNRAEIVLEGFDPDTSEVVVDAAAIFAEVDVDEPPDMVSDTLPGCMAFPGDPECPAMFAALGLRYLDEGPAGAQRVFSVRAR